MLFQLLVLFAGCGVAISGVSGGGGSGGVFMDLGVGSIKLVEEKGDSGGVGGEVDWG